MTGESGVKMTGPYDYVAPSYWYVDQHNGGAFGFNTETSPGPAIPSLASRQQVPARSRSVAAFSDLGSPLMVAENSLISKYSMRRWQSVYGTPHSSAEYERMAQTMEYDSERAMYEAYGKNKYVSTGVIQWMLNNAWPSMIWHLYDYYLDAGAGYFAAKKACEPLHIQYSYDDQSIIVVNSTYGASTKLHASVKVHDLDWKELYATEADLTSAPDSAQRILALPENLYVGSDRLLFVELSLTDASGKVVSHNFYWVPTTTNHLRLAANRLHTHTRCTPRRPNSPCASYAGDRSNPRRNRDHKRKGVNYSSS